MDNQWTTTDRQFGAALRALLSDRPEFLTKTGNINWASVAEAMPIYYETLRKAVAGERQPSRPLMELAAKLAGVRATYFAEYRLSEMCRQLDPAEVGWEAGGSRSLTDIRDEEPPPYGWFLGALAVLLAIISIALMDAAQCDLHLYQPRGIAAIVTSVLAVVAAGAATTLGVLNGQRSKDGAIGVGVVTAFFTALALLIAYGIVFLNATC